MIAPLPSSSFFPLTHLATHCHAQQNPKKFKKSTSSAHKPIVSAKRFKKAMYVRYARSLAQPGEAVGLLAAQSIGEPSTQMTLNTFHLAGHGAVNVTLGIPRMREIVMTQGQGISTPSMTVPLLDSHNHETALQLAARLRRIHLEEFIRDVTVRETIETHGGVHHRVYCVKMSLMRTYIV